MARNPKSEIQNRKGEMDTLIKDLRFAARMLAKKPAFTLIVVLALGIGIGANTAIFSVVNAILLRPLPYENPERIMMVWMDNRKMGANQDYHSYLNFVDYKEQNQVFEQVAIFQDRTFNITGAGEPERVAGAWSTAELFSVLGVEPEMGHIYENESPRVALISHGLWQRRFGSDPNILGQEITLNTIPRTIIGVMPAGFDFPQKEADIWVPLEVFANHKKQRDSFWLTMIGRLKPAVTPSQAQAEMSTIASRLEQQYPDVMIGYGVNVVPLHEQVTGSVRPALLVLLGAVAFVLLIACANVANLLLARAATREKEIAIRTAVGASRARLIRQLLTETALLALAGGAVGLLFAMWGLDILIALSPAEIPRLNQVGIDGRVLSFTLLISLTTGLIFGLVPALQASKPDLNETLKEGGRASTGGNRSSRMRSLLVVSEIALSLVLLIGAGLMIKSFIHLQQFNLGFNPKNLLTIRVGLPWPKYGEGDRAAVFYRQLIERVENLQGVQSAGVINGVFLGNAPDSLNFQIEGRAESNAGENIEASIDSISPDYFKTMAIPLLKGREFTERDTQEAPGVIIVNDSFARRFFPDEDPIGKRLKYDAGDGLIWRTKVDKPWLTIVGVVADARRTGFDAEVRPEVYAPHTQRVGTFMTLVARTSGDPLSLVTAVRSQVWAVDPDQSVYDIKSMEQLLGDMISERRFSLLLLGTFAGLALLLAAVGVYGVMSYSVTQRTHEIGVRMALGARHGDVLRLVVGQCLTLVLTGVATGLAAAFVLTRLMSSLLYEVSATDPMTFAVIALLLSGVALGACFVPARRAARVDPMVALRYE
jgi:putative ABC transport system permease protein